MMFRKRLRLKKATKYPAPKYPVMESGQVLSVPKELRLGDLVRPIAPIVLSAGLAAGGGGRSASAQDGRAALVASIAPGKIASTVAQDRKDIPDPVRGFTRREIENLISELNLEYTYPENVKGDVAARTPPLTESQGAKILGRFFAKNGLSLRSDFRLQKGDVDFVVDGYDVEKNVGFEFVPEAGDADLTADEISRVEKGIEGENILLVRGHSRGLPRPEEVVRQLQQAASAYLAKLYRDGALGRAKEIERLVADLTPKAAEALQRIGPEALWWLRRKPDDERAKAVVDAIYREHILPHLGRLDDERLAIRDESTERLIAMGPSIIPFVESHLREAAGNSEVETRCENILKTIREEALR